MREEGKCGTVEMKWSNGGLAFEAHDCQKCCSGEPFTIHPVAVAQILGGLVYPDPVRVVAIGRKIEDLLTNLENDEWLSISAELCGGTQISNT
nr:alanine--tRNA ligase-like [Ipomoea batatas]